MRQVWDLPINWILKPFIMIAMIIGYIYQIIVNLKMPRNQKYWAKDYQMYNMTKYKTVVDELYSKSPAYRKNKEDLYCLRVPYDKDADGKNHNFDHQCARHGVYVAAQARLSKDTTASSKSLALHAMVHNGEVELRRGYVYDNAGSRVYSEQPVSGDMLVGLLFGWFHSRTILSSTVIQVAEKLVKYCGLRTCGNISSVANFKPGIQFGGSETPIPVGAQEITYLAALKAAWTSADICGAESYKKMFRNEYLKRFWLYGGFITVLIPTIPVLWFHRGQNNDNVTIQAAYILNKLSSNWFEKFIYTVSMFNIWVLSWPTLNGFFTALLRDCVKWFPMGPYVGRCLSYGIDSGETKYSITSDKNDKARMWPVPCELMNRGEFYPDEDHEFERIGKPEYRSTVGQLAMLVFF